MRSNYEYLKAWRSRTKDRLLEAFGNRCGLCGYARCAGALEFHHLDPTSKDFSISSWRHVCAWDKLVVEVRKCVLLCANCHREVHHGLISPENAVRFNEDYAAYTEDKSDTPCPTCGKLKMHLRKYCSHKCARLAKSKVLWDTIDICALLSQHDGNYAAVGRLLGVTGAAVHKRHRKLLGH